MSSRQRLTFHRKFKASQSRVLVSLGVIREVTKMPRKHFVQITVLDVNVFRKSKGAVTTADVEIVIIFTEDE